MLSKARRMRSYIGLAALALAVGGFALAPATASAAPKPGKPQASEQHCTFNVSTAEAQCFGTFQEAIAHATGGRVTDAPNDFRAAMADSKLAAELNSDSVGPDAVVIGVEYLFEGFGTPSVTVSGSHACTGPTSDRDFRTAPLPTVGGINWNNNIRSFQGFNGCWQRMWDNSNCTVLLRNYAGSSSDLGSARDRTQCIDWS